MNNNRIIQANALVKKNKLDAMIVSKLSNIRYLSGYSGSNGLLILAPPKSYFLTDFRYTVQARKEVKNSQIIIAERELVSELVKLPCFCKKAKVGFETAIMTVKALKKMKELLIKSTFIPTENLVESISIVKDTSEINKIKRAVKISDTAFSQILDRVKPGVKERDLALELSYSMIKMGADGPSFDFIVASGQRSSMPHGKASDKKLKKGDLITFDFGCFYNGYASDMTRTVVLGKATDKQKKIYNIVLKAQTAAIDATRAGMDAKELDKVARDIINKEGYGDYFGHGLGHGLSLEVHSGPVVSPRSQDTLKVGNVITIEPGIYLPNWGGVRIEDDILITQNGCRVLTKSPRELIEL
ncbi:MAG: aminopeptidase P family protein [candidate division Zixibacteria bacterium]|nr:aminopeptidase P family protein [candidate division Zixibacteria bacterium]